MDEETLQELAYWEERLAEAPNTKLERKQVAQAFQDAFDASGGTAGLAMWASRNRGDFYKLYGKLMPKEQHSTHDGTLRVVHAIAPSALDLETGNTYEGTAERLQGSVHELQEPEAGVWEGPVQRLDVQSKVYTEKRDSEG